MSNSIPNVRQGESGLNFPQARLELGASYGRLLQDTHQVVKMVLASAVNSEREQLYPKKWNPRVDGRRPEGPPLQGRRSTQESGRCTAGRPSFIAGETMTDLYDKVKLDVAFRWMWAEECGVGFELPSTVPMVLKTVLSETAAKAA